MKIKQLILILFLISSALQAQEKVGFDVRKINKLTLPYSTEQFANRTVYNNRRLLHAQDSAFIMNQLLRKTHTIINYYGGTGFGDMDYQDSISFKMQMEDASKISVIGMIQIGNCYLVHFELRNNIDMDFGILALMSANGEIYNWLFSNGSANGGNPHGNLTRDFTITAKKEILFSESSWGDNTESYEFTGKFIVSKSEDDLYYEFKIRHISFKED